MTTSHREGAQYAGAVAEAQQQLEHIPDAANWPLSERLGAFFFILLDAVEECATKEDVDHPAGAFRRSAAGWFSPFQESLREALPSVGVSKDVSGVNRWLAEFAPNRVVMAEVMVQLIEASLEDETDDRQRSAALADRVLTVLTGLWSTPIPSQVVDVIRYSIEAGYLPVDKLPLIRSWFEEEDLVKDEGTGGLTDSDSEKTEDQGHA
ncbi:MAG: hypothetical protein ACPG8N_00880 [Rhodothermales bacterium]